MRLSKSTIKDALGGLPLSAEMYWYLRQTGKPPVGGYSLDRLEKALPDWSRHVQTSTFQAFPRRKVMTFGMLRYWVEHTVLMGLCLSGLGHDVTYTYLPYANWKKAVPRFDIRRHNLYVKNVLKGAEAHINVVPLLGMSSDMNLPAEVRTTLEEAAYRDVQYSLLREDVDLESELYNFRLTRNEDIARSIYAWMCENNPEVVIIPNGSILEFGIVFHIAQYLGIPTVTYEFGEQYERMWMAFNADVMRQETDEMWAARRDHPLYDRQWEYIRRMFAVRQGGGLWENFSRRWQGVPNKGGEQVRNDLGLDSRPIVLLPTNVLGDSLTLGRHLISESMIEWLIKTIQYFSNRLDVQLVIRVHPGEQLGSGPSIYDTLMEHFTDLSSNIQIIPSTAEVNTYDLVQIADLGLVYTTTLGMEMVMSGLPVIVAGQTHYKGKGFTLDPKTWDEYIDALTAVLNRPDEYRLPLENVEQAWIYAYRFFFEYPRPYPWHVQHFWADVKKWPLDRVLSDEGQERFGETLNNLVGVPIDWSREL